MVINQDDFENNHKERLDIDEALLVRIGQDDQEALTDLYVLTHRVIYTYALSLIKNHEDALDIVQDTYIKIRSAAHLYQPMGKPLAWMFTITRHITLNMIRKNKRSQAFDQDVLENNTSFSYIEDPEDKMVLQMALKILSEEERQIVLLHSVGGFKHREISELTDLALGTVLSKYNRGLKKLRKALKKGGGYDEQ
jgi:RNA polymerase sigma-70 factor (ECF subfamily)